MRIQDIVNQPLTNQPLTNQPLTNQQIIDWADNVQDRFNLISFSVWKTGHYLKLGLMRVDNKNVGTGTEVMREFCKFADDNGLTGVLSPAKPSDDFGTSSTSRLIKFYKRFGFVENKGRNRDFGTSESMIRPLINTN